MNKILKQDGPTCVANAFFNMYEILTGTEPPSQKEIRQFYKSHPDSLLRRGGMRTKEFLKLIYKGEWEGIKIRGYKQMYGRYWGHGLKRKLKLGAWNQICRALKRGRKVGFMLGVDKKFQVNKKNEITFKDKTGGHQMAIIGIGISGRLLIENSWSEDWGDSGLAYLTEEEFYKGVNSVYKILI